MLNSRSLMVLSLALLAGAARAQERPSPRQVIDDYLKAIGGKEELGRVKSLRTRGTMNFRVAGQRATFELLQMRPNKTLLVTDLAGVVKIREGFDGKVGWSLNPVTGAALLKDQELKEKAEDADLAGDLHLDKNYKSMENLGEVTFDKKKCWKLKFVRNSGVEVIEYYDVATKLRAGSEREMRTPGGTARVVTTVLEYKTFGKIKHMGRFRQSLPDTDVITEISSVEYDKVDEKAFALPPEIQALLKKEKE